MVLLAHISDLHIDGGGRAAARVERVLDFLNGMARPVDAVLATGDLTDNGLESEYDELGRLLGPEHGLLLCPGNHDVRGPYRRVLLGEPASDEPINRVHDLPEVRVVMCDSSVPGRDDGHLADETLGWLDEVLGATPATTPVLLALHHPPVLLHSPFIDEIRQYGAERLASLLDRHDQVVAVLTGHAHTPAVSRFAGRPLLVAPAVASTLRLPWENDMDLDYEMPPALAFHVLDDAGRLTTHFRLVA
ncbi:MAG: 3',5'-cyclic-nucleotide phosphodiesterase [uncultured Nocardioidaceae bacterium]|uniref:3',5'-cyclic-nucleotide phosphodiesterase n=1 Tax=uncultured Nocardioidaceae bacterium TaxID=253824 RepID=A0A6J4MDU2_9ACTN|nr:MAG: 3',5'-cyclic-nucleotide phosphodiesterase [uncultured Nocardioidaceae bacterium]